VQSDNATELYLSRPALALRRGTNEGQAGQLAAAERSNIGPGQPIVVRPP
jgi:hypothetical protein